MNFAVTDHAVERYRQRVPRRSGELDVRPEIISRVARAWAEGSHEPGEKRADVRVIDLERRDLVFVCRLDLPRDELLVVTLWEEGEGAAVPRAYTDALLEFEPRKR